MGDARFAGGEVMARGGSGLIEEALSSSYEEDPLLSFLSGEGDLASGEYLLSSGDAILGSGEAILGSGEAIRCSGEAILGSGESTLGSGDAEEDLDSTSSSALLGSVEGDLSTT